MMKVSSLTSKENKWLGQQKKMSRKRVFSRKLRTELELSCISIWYQEWGFGCPIGE
jgi:hypothetical protein